MNLYLPIEILNREFQSKLLIAMESASRGMKVYMGRLVPYLKKDHFVPGIVLQKSITPSPQRLKELRYYKKKKFIVTSLDEEVGLFDLDNNDYLKLRYSNQSLELADKVFAWGKWDYNNLCKKFKKHKKKFILSGNPRLDFWKKNFDFFYENKKLKYKDYIFFSLNLSFLISKKEFNKYLTFLRDSDYINRGFGIKKAIKLREDSHKMFKKFSKLITTLSKKTDLKIIVRPHPTEKIKNYNFLKKYSNVKVIKEGNISEWIYYAKTVVHSSCTGGLEASIRGRPTISYLPFKSSHGHQFADSYSIKTKNLNECLNTIKKVTKDNKKIKKYDLKSIKFRAHNFSSNKPSYKIIADEFIKLMNLNKINYQNNDLFLKFKFKLRDLRSKILKNKYGTIKFSIFDKDETLKIFEIFKKLNPKFNDLTIDFIKKDIIQIKNNG